MGSENYMFGLTVGTLRAALTLLGKRERKTSGSRGGTRGPVGRENYLFWFENE